MPQLRGEEEWARVMIETALGSCVQQHDDGSQPSMYDLDIIGPEGVSGAVEVTAAASSAALQQWNEMNGRGRWTVPDLLGGWVVHIRTGSSRKALDALLPSILKELEVSEVESFEVDRPPITSLEQAIAELGVTYASRGPTTFPGSVYLLLDEGVDWSRRARLEEWVGEFLREPKQLDVLSKLLVAAAPQRHAFIFMPVFNTAPQGMTDPLLLDPPVLPSHPPLLPAPVTHVWLTMALDMGMGLRWAPDSGWLTFDKCLESTSHLLTEG